VSAGRIGGFQGGSAQDVSAQDDSAQGGGAQDGSAQGGGKPRPYYIRSMSYGCGIVVQGEHTCLEHVQTLGCSFCFVGSILFLLFS
jgi:hypothetical protein